MLVDHSVDRLVDPRELDIPRFDACYSDDWTDWVIEKWSINTNCRELIDNVSDMAHFIAVHGVPVPYFANIFGVNPVGWRAEHH